MEILKLYTPIQPDALTGILRFLPELQKLTPDEVFVRSPGRLVSEKPLTFAMHGEYHPLVDQFLQALYEHGFVQSYDWSKFHQQAEKFYKQPKSLQRATLRTCVKLITFHARRDLFVDGHFASMVKDGHMIAILERLAAPPFPRNVKKEGSNSKFY